MSDLVFVMYNLKLKRRQENRASKWRMAVHRAARRFTRQATRDENESLYTELQDNVVEVQTPSDEDDHAKENEAAVNFIGSNEIDLDDFGVVDDTDIGGTTTGADLGSDDVDGGSFGFDD
ncbi:uncharacterized protein LOC110697580 [Chenopodium quinoa]|uniref:uncharacterized protein LOC110697580 n=1 Tax=Chenopodium quinoa TaxID=63459 RepID=UPI000B77A8A7|nr:uncharacterized protein LOC110697580 [Chenopodium quinoa]